MSGKTKILLFLVLVLGLVLRWYKIKIPLADHHSWRQSDTAAVARNFIKEGWQFLFPRIDNKVPLHPGRPNNERLFLVEPPVYNSLVAGVYQLFGVKEIWARLVSVAFSLGSMIFLFLLAANYFGWPVGILSAFFFAILPYNVFYSRGIMPEPMIIFLNLGMFYLAIKWLKTNSWLNYWFLIFFSSLSFSQKSFPLFLLLPLFYLFFQKFGLKIIKQKKLYFWFFVSLTPLVLWRIWINRFPEGIPANLWLLNQGGIRFKGAFFWWLFAERIGKLILGYWGLPLLVLGIIIKPKKDGWFFHYWLLAILIFMAVFAAGNVTHDYYQIPLVPIFCIFMARGASFLLFEKDGNFHKIFSFFTLAACVLLMSAFSWYQVRDFYNLQSGVDLAGRWIDENTPKQALVLTGDSNDASLLYNCNRWGWSGGYASAYPNESAVIENLKTQGASYYVTTKFDQNSDFGKYMLKNYPALKQTDQYIVFSLAINP